MALVLGLGGMVGCGDDSGGGDAGGTTSTTSTTSATGAASEGDSEDLTAAVDEFCAKVDAVKERFEQVQGGEPGEPLSSEVEAELSDLVDEALPLMTSLQGQQAQMLPGDAARFRRCAELFGGSVNVTPG